MGSEHEEINLSSIIIRMFKKHITKFSAKLNFKIKIFKTQLLEYLLDIYS